MTITSQRKLLIFHSITYSHYVEFEIFLCHKINFIIIIILQINLIYVTFNIFYMAFFINISKKYFNKLGIKNVPLYQNKTLFLVPNSLLIPFHF